jgi:hypothetical protein
MKIANNEIKWHKVDKMAAEKLTTITNSPGEVYPMDNSLLPEQIKKMTGVTSYYASGYTSTEVNSLDQLISGEIVVARIDGHLTKNYNYIFCVSSDSNVYFSGPYKGFGHHVPSDDSIEVSSLFGQSPFGKSKF